MERYALLVIDMQKAYFRSEELEEAKSGLVSCINRLLDAGVDIPIFSIITEHRRDKSTWTLNMLEDGQGFLFEGDEETELVDGLRTESATTIIKTRDSAFHDTVLNNELAKHNITSLLICGVSTQSCIYQTAADAYANDYKVLLVDDAIASHDPSFHEDTLTLLAKEYRQKRLTTDAVVRLIADARA